MTTLSSTNPLSPSHLREEALARAEAIVASLAVPAGCALVATGSFAREEMTTFSDLDLLLIHEPGVAPSQSQLADLWYPIWDNKYRLDYSVRTPLECAEMIAADSTAALALLEMRHLRGPEHLTQHTRAIVLQRWRREIQRNFNTLVSTAATRWRRAGSVVAMTHPDIKHGRGGLRDIELLRALSMANLCDMPDLSAEKTLLIDVRVLLHHCAHRLRDVLDPEFAQDIAMHVGCADRYELSAGIAVAARRIDEALTAALSGARDVLSRGAGREAARGRGKLSKRPLDLDVVDAGGTITLSRHPDMSDPALLLRVAAAAARTGLPVAESTWIRLKALPPLPEVWPAAATDDFFALLSSPLWSAEVIAALDRHGFWARMVPEWEHIRGLMPKERSHIHTIDVHSLVTVANCAAETTAVGRPDLLLLAALFHDIGKGYGRPHAQVGAQFVARMAQRLGLNLLDRSRVQTLVAEHTFLARLAATADPHARSTRDRLLDALHYDLISVNLLEVLTEADAKATGPGVWNRRLEQGLRIICANARRALTELAPSRPIVYAPTELGVSIDETEQCLKVWWRGDSPADMVRLLSLFSAKAWNVLGARVLVDRAVVVSEWDVRPATDTLRNAADTQALIQAYNSRVYSTLPVIEPAPSAILWKGNVVEIRAVDKLGCLGALGALVAVLPDFSWLKMDSHGASISIQASLRGRVDRPQVERNVTRALVTG